VILAVTVRGALERRYGASGYQQIRTALNAFAEAAQGFALAVDDPVDMSPLGISPLGTSDAGSILLSIRALRRQLSDPQPSLLLVGGDDIVPFWKINNPVVDRTIDPDPVVTTDNPYGTNGESLEQYLAPPIYAGRLPDNAAGSAQEFADLISLATTYRRERPIRPGSGVVVNSDWNDWAHEAASTLPDPVDWHVSPGYVMNGGTRNDTNHGILYFNLHGFSGESEWKGYDQTRGQYVTAVTPDAFDRRFVSGSVVFAENCYGAQVSERTPQNSCALRLVREGAAFIGAAGLAFGSHLVPRMFLEDADCLARSFFARFSRSQQDLGTALGGARADYLTDTNTPVSDPYKQKTLLQFVLLGDPGWS